MHILMLSQRNGAAQARMLRAGEALAKRLDLDPALIEGLKSTSKDSAVRALKEREGVAALLEELAYSAGALERPEQAPPEEPKEGELDEAVTVVTNPEPTDQAVTEAAPTEPVIIQDDTGPDGLPAPTLEDVESEPPAEEEPVAEAGAALSEEQPAAEEEPPAPEPVKMPRGKRTKK